MPKASTKPRKHAKAGPARKIGVARAKTQVRTGTPAKARRGKEAVTSEAQSSLADEIAAVVAWLERRGSKKVRDGMARYAIPSDKAFGIAVGELRTHAKQLGRSHALAEGLWETGFYEARMLATFVDDPASVTAAQMDRWCRDFDNWAICDTACFHLFDRTPHAWAKVEAWAGRREEFVKRAAFASLASLSVHDKRSGDEPFVRGLRLVEQAADDERNFVKKAVNWALRSVGKRNADLHAAAVEVARELAESSNAAARWVGKDALRELTSDAVQRRLATRRKAHVTG